MKDDLIEIVAELEDELVCQNEHEAKSVLRKTKARLGQLIKAIPDETDSELEARTDRNMRLIASFCDLLKEEFEIEIPEQAIMHFFNG